MLINMQHIKHG